MSRRPRQQWRLNLTGLAWKQFNALSRDQKQGVFDALLPLLESVDPHNLPGVKKLKGKFEGWYRVRTGDHRVIYVAVTLPDDPRYRGDLHILKISDRKDAY